MAKARLRIGVVGAGAIGTAIANSLLHVGVQVSVVARGARRDSIRSNGLRSHENGEVRTAFPAVVEMEDLADRDLIILATKATALPEVLPQISSILAPAALVMPAVNGLPWWYFQDEGPLSGTVLHSVDPGGMMQRLLPADRLIGCVVYSRVSMRDDGEVEVLGQQRLKIGRIGPGPHPEAVAAQLTNAGIDVTLEDNIRREVWRKLVLNASTNLVSGLTGATLEQIGHDGKLLELTCEIAREVVGLSERVGCAAEVDMVEFTNRIKGAGPFATSMLQDVRAGRMPELDAIAIAPLEMARLIRYPMRSLQQTTSLLSSKIRYPIC